MYKQLSKAEFAGDIILEFAGENDLEITDKQLATLAAYQAHVLDVNRRMNLTRITDPADFAVKHIIDSLTLLPFIPPGASLIDIGTGAGFPGMVLGIMREDLRLTLLDSTRKRVDFLRETADMLGVQAECVHARAEEYSAPGFDICTARAVAAMDKLAGYALPLVKPGGVFLAMKGPEISREIEMAKPAIEKHGGFIENIHMVKLSHARTHSVVAIRKCVG